MQQYILKQLLIALCLYTGQILIGYSMGWTAPVIPKLQDPDETPLPTPATDGQVSWIGSVLYIGSITGPYLTGYLSSLQGRKTCLLIGAAFVALSFLLLGLANSLIMIYAGRIAGGFGSAILVVMNMVYLGEIASTNIRGILLTGTGIFLTLGTLVIYSVGPYVSYAMTSYIGLAITICNIIGILLIPETPVYEVLRGKPDEAKATLISLGRTSDVEIVLKTVAEQKTSALDDWKEIVTVRSNRRAFIITLTIGILVQMSGVVIMIFFATTIFQLAGSTIEPNLATIIIGVTQLGASCVAPVFVERSGRRYLLLSSSLLCCVSLTILGIYFFLADSGYNVESVGWLPLASLILFFLSYDFGFGIIPGTLTSEMFRSNVRSTGSTVTSTIAWLFGFGLSTAFGYMINGLGGAITFWFFALGCLGAFLFTLFFIPETKGKTLYEIQEMLSK